MAKKPETQYDDSGFTLAKVITKDKEFPIWLGNQYYTLTGAKQALKFLSEAIEYLEENGHTDEK
jgi:prefoldin subunit 5